MKSVKRLGYSGAFLFGGLMAITYPRALPRLCAAVTGTTDLMRFQSTSLDGMGDPFATEIAPPTWRGQYAITAVGREQIAELAAWVRSMRGAIKTFKAIPVRTGKLYRWPLAHPRGFSGMTVSGSPWDGTGTLETIGSQRDEVTITDLPDDLTLSVGDYVSIEVSGKNHLHMVTGGGTASSGDLTITVEPPIRVGVTADKVIRFEYPFCEMSIVGDVTEPQDSAVSMTVSFTAYQKKR